MLKNKLFKHRLIALAVLIATSLSATSDAIYTKSTTICSNPKPGKQQECTQLITPIWWNETNLSCSSISGGLNCKNDNYWWVSTQEISANILGEVSTENRKYKPNFRIKGYMVPNEIGTRTPAITAYDGISIGGNNGLISSFSTALITNKVTGFYYFEPNAKVPSSSPAKYLKVNMVKEVWGHEKDDPKKEHILIEAASCDTNGIPDLTYLLYAFNIRPIGGESVDTSYNPAVDPYGQKTIDSVILQLNAYLKLAQNTCKKNKGKKGVVAKYTKKDFEKALAEVSANKIVHDFEASTVSNNSLKTTPVNNNGGYDVSGIISGAKAK
jgi:hypothetical protein